MRILYAITSNGLGRGGHYHSLDHISRVMAGAKVCDVRILSVGVGESPVLEKNPHFLGHVPIHWRSLRATNREMGRLLSTFKAEVIHCFDVEALLSLQFLPSCRDYPFVLSRCGGPNHKSRFCPVANSVVLFSRENYDWYADHPAFRNADLHLIPNRVAEVQLLPEGERFYKRDDSAFNFVRIARIGRNYEKSLNQALHLVELLAPHRRVHLWIVGVVQDEEVYVSLQDRVRKGDLPVTFITDRVTEKASRLLYLADCVIGTGRGVMEAMSLGLPVLAPVQNGRLPVLVSPATFDLLFTNNFSERSVISNDAKDEALDDVIRLIDDKSFRKAMSSFSVATFEKEFSLSGAISRYMEVYRKATLRKGGLLSVCNVPHLIRYLLKVRRTERRAVINAPK